MAKKTVSYYGRVRTALRELCAGAPSPGEILFRTYFSAEVVAMRAGCSIATARKHLNRLAVCRGYSMRRLRGVHAYRYDGE